MVSTCRAREAGSESCGGAADARGDCCNGLDDDCDGFTDEDLGCTFCSQAEAAVEDGAGTRVPCNGCNEQALSVPMAVCIPSGIFVRGELEPFFGCDIREVGGCRYLRTREITTPLMMQTN